MCPKGPESSIETFCATDTPTGPSLLPACNAVWRIAFRDPYSHKLSEKRQPLGVGARWWTSLTATVLQPG